MSLGIIGKKIGMTSIFIEDGSIVPVTVVQAGPCPIMQIKSSEKDGYNALQLGFDSIEERKLNKPGKGHQDKVGKGYFRTLREFKIQNVDEYELGQDVTVENFALGEKVKISGTSKGKGFAGVMKKWNFSGAPATHGHHKVHRTPGSIGQMSYPARVFKGKKMPGRMGNKKTTYKNSEIIDVRRSDNLLLIKGQVPGANNSIVYIRKQD